VRKLWLDRVPLTSDAQQVLCAARKGSSLCRRQFLSQVLQLLQVHASRIQSLLHGLGDDAAGYQQEPCND
jgi:hypothetical protein